MVMNSCEKIGINKALNRFGGFVRYYDTTESLPLLAKLVSTGDCQDILACCAGGNQVLTMLGASQRVRALWAIDNNPAQLFVLAAKAVFLKKKKSAPFLPSFGQIQRMYPQRVVAVERDLRHLNRLYHLSTGKETILPSGFAGKYAVLHEEGIFVLEDSGPFWQKDPLFAARIRSRLSRIRFLWMDIFNSPAHFKPGAFDLIYLSDIFWPGTTPFHIENMRQMARLLRMGGRIVSRIGYYGENFLGRGGVLPARILVPQAQELALQVETDNPGYFVLRRKGKGR